MYIIYVYVIYGGGCRGCTPAVRDGTLTLRQIPERVLWGWASMPNRFFKGFLRIFGRGWNPGPTTDIGFRGFVGLGFHAQPLMSGLAINNLSPLFYFINICPHGVY